MAIYGFFWEKARGKTEGIFSPLPVSGRGRGLGVFAPFFLQPAANSFNFGKMAEPVLESNLPRWKHPGGKLVELGAEKLSDAEEFTAYHLQKVQKTLI